MQTYSGPAVFTDDGGTRHDIHVELEEIRDGEWAGILDGPVDWEALMGDRELMLELVDPDALGLPRVSCVRVDLVAGDRAAANGAAWLCQEAELVDLTTGSPAPAAARESRRHPRAIHWHAAR